MSTLDHRAGFKADAALATGFAVEDLSRRRLRAGQLFLRGLSAALLLFPVGAVVTAGWVLIAQGRRGILLAVPLLVVAFVLRPRLPSARRLRAHRYRLEPSQTPALHGLIHQIADATGAPRPHEVLLSREWNAETGTAGLRRRRMLSLGIPMLVSLTPQEMVALIAHELGHLRHQDTLRQTLTQPACTFFGRLARLVRPPSLARVGILNPIMALWYLVGVPIAWLLWTVHLGLNILDARESRRAELRADLLTAEAAGTIAALGLADRLAVAGLYAQGIGGTVPKGAAVSAWRKRANHVWEQHHLDLRRYRQLSIREQASLFASHPAPGRRHQVLSGIPFRDPAVVVGEAQAARIDAELSPYAEALLSNLAERYEM